MADDKKKEMGKAVENESTGRTEEKTSSCGCDCIPIEKSE